MHWTAQLQISPLHSAEGASLVARCPNAVGLYDSTCNAERSQVEDDGPTSRRHEQERLTAMRVG